MKVGSNGTTITGPRLRVSAIVWIVMLVVIGALIATGLPIGMTQMTMKDEGSLIAVTVANERADPRTGLTEPKAAWERSEALAEEQHGSIPIDSFFITPEGVIQFEYVKTVDTPIWKQIGFLKPYTVRTVQIEGSAGIF